MTATHEANPPRARQDRRAVWDNSPELRDSVRDDLYEWGGAQRGGMPNLGYPTRDSIFTDDESKTIRYNADKVQAMNDTFTLWAKIIQTCGDENAKRIFAREFKVIKHYFIGEEPVESIAEKCGCGVATVYRSLGSGMYRFWSLHW